MKKIIAFAISLVLCFNLCIITVNATDYNPDASISDIWKYMRETGNLIVGNDGLLHVCNKDEMSNYEKGAKFIETINVCNEAILDGILVVDSDAVKVSSVIQLDKEIIPYGINDNFTMPNNFQYRRGGAHGCSVQSLDLLRMCKRNLETIKAFYSEMCSIIYANENLDPFMATVSYWIGFVRPGGPWDYKSKPGFKPYSTLFCSYYKGGFHHITSEYIGNFNYGFTGRCLFDIFFLKTGSMAVAGFSSKDKLDWPAIEDGYYQNTYPGIESPGFTDGSGGSDPGFSDGN